MRYIIQKLAIHEPVYVNVLFLLVSLLSIHAVYKTWLLSKRDDIDVRKQIATLIVAGIYGFITVLFICSIFLPIKNEVAAWLLAVVLMRMTYMGLIHILADLHDFMYHNFRWWKDKSDKLEAGETNDDTKRE